MNSFAFEIIGADPASRARAGRLRCPHGTIETPVLAPVGTKATVKSLTPQDLKRIGVELLLVNAYHLYLNPGSDVLRRLGGVHEFMASGIPAMSDSGGFQVFSLGSAIRDGVGKIAGIFPNEGAEAPGSRKPRPGEGFVRIDENGVAFRSPYDGSTHRFDPSKSIRIQQEIGADFILAFDECTSPYDSHAYTKTALARTHRWALESAEAFARLCSAERQSLFGIVQGGAFRDLREQSARFLSGLPFFGFSIGGSLGRTKADMLGILDWVVPLLPAGAPRHMLGIGHIDDVFHCVERGIDIFDCVVPTRWARTGLVIVDPKSAAERRPALTGNRSAMRRNFSLNIRNAAFADDTRPLDPYCGCHACRHFSSAYIHYLYKERALLGYALLTIHNVSRMIDLLKTMRSAIVAGRFGELKRSFLGSA
jgi:queuine tRNA-ribosyltransferase/7-cyano-7-deazaguanine tRNA-ribosyltransferase